MPLFPLVAKSLDDLAAIERHKAIMKWAFTTIHLTNCLTLGDNHDHQRCIDAFAQVFDPIRGNHPITQFMLGPADINALIEAVYRWQRDQFALHQHPIHLETQLDPGDAA